MKKNNLSLKLATERDTDNLRSLANEIWYTTYPVIISQQQIDYMLKKMYDIGVIKKEIESNIEWYMILYEDEPIGFLSFELVREGVCKLHKFYIKLEFQNKGVGRRIFENIKEILIKKHTNTISLNVNRFNTNAIHAYQKYGFTIQKSIDIPYGEFILNDYIMTCSLV